jgi:uncharacterized protein (DUF362 family)
MGCYGTLPRRGFSESARKLGEEEIKLSNILEKEVSILINMPVLKDHGTLGITAALKNHYGSFNIPWKFHSNCGDPHVAELNALGPIKEKTKLIICDAFRPACHGGPGNHPKYRWNHGGLLVSADPVAVDRVGWQIIERQRKEKGLRSLAEERRKPEYIYTAERLKLGEATLSKITGVEVLV